jgi:hypothetical protein
MDPMNIRVIEDKDELRTILETRSFLSLAN